MKSVTGKGIPDDSELLYLADHINIRDTGCVNAQWKDEFPVLYL